MCWRNPGGTSILCRRLLPRRLPREARVSHDAIPAWPARHDLWISLVLCLATFGVYAQVGILTS